MNRYKLFMAGIDTNDGIKRFNGNAELYEKCLLSFLNDNNYTQMCQSIKEQNVSSAFTAAHSLKGIAGNLSMKKLYDDIVPLVEELRAGKVENTEVLLKPVAQDYQQIISVLDQVQ